MRNICPYCKSKDVLYSKKNNLYICEDCGERFNLEVSANSLKIFFSYGHDDNEQLVLRIKQDLESRGHSIWIDKSEIKSGDNWRKQITDGLIDSSTVLGFLSKHSVRNPGVCLDELKIAVCVKHAYMKTILLESENSICIPTSVSDVQWLDLSDWKIFYNKKTKEWEEWYTRQFEEICRIVESEETISFNGELEKLKLLLEPNLLDSKERYLLSQQYSGREWLDDIVNQWIDNPNASRAFVLIAGPGIGKSCFVAHLLHYNPYVVCGVFCEWDKPLTTNIKVIIKTIAFKLASKLPDYRILLLNIYSSIKKEIQKKRSEELMDLLIINPISNLIDGGRQTLLIVIDGLDEVPDAQSDLLIKLFANNLKRLPKWLKFILTSRPENRVELLFEEYQPQILRPDDINQTKDIRDYILMNITEQLSLCADKLTILDKLVEKCQGNYLYATLLVKNIRANNIDIKTIDSYPLGLNAFYYQDFKRKYKITENYADIKYVLEIIVAAKNLPIDMLPLFGIDKWKKRSH